MSNRRWTFLVLWLAALVAFHAGSSGQGMAIPKSIKDQPAGQSVPRPRETARAEYPPIEGRLLEEGAEIGDPVTLEIEMPGGQSGEALSLSPMPGATQPLLLEDPQPAGDGSTWRVPATLLAGGEVTVGPYKVDVTIGGEKQTFQLGPFAFQASAPGEAPGEPRDYTNPLAAPANWSRLLAMGAIAAVVLAGVLALLIWILWKIFRKKDEAAVVAEPPVMPLEQALQALGDLRRMEVFRSQGTKAHYAALSFLLRRYFERAYGFNALEMTEDEMIDLIRRDLHGQRGTEALRHVFEQASLAKFARWTASETEARDDLEPAAAFLRAEEERERMAREHVRAQGQAQQAGKREAA